MKAKIAVQELHALVQNEDIIFKLEADIRKADKKVKLILEKIEKNSKTTALGSQFWIKKEMAAMNSYKPGNNIADKLKMWEK
eukprot:CAMPEP_0116939744 /NCGR_PEP_ID=MMETSP0467-20121206/32934_1 /TAXON_ID=283647 /ORGANISM="Mesodinium pulex, Strain SPMC105" /LENGTH=81 /DNA_ID=CAMNT_0004622113 /DNA_START=601 /DNA_END=846 /DNA_ORIENTATION=-